MGMTKQFAAVEPTRAEIDRLEGPVVLEFGTAWCSFCRAAQPLIETAFAGYAEVQHMKVEDGSGRPLGRSFKIKLWPTLIFLRDGAEIGRLVRPQDAAAITRELTRLAS